jgi:hypothetical protein
MRLISLRPAVNGTQGNDDTLNATFLIAAAINAHGSIALQAVYDGKPAPGVRAEFSLGPSGELMQRCYQTGTSETGTAAAVGTGVYRKEPLDMLFLAECLTRAFGPITPALFRVGGPAKRGQRRLEAVGEQYDRKRLRMLHEAFNLYLLAYEERLI